MNNKKTINPPMNPGISLLLVVFLVLCLFTFSAITLASALNEKNRSEALGRSTRDYYTASNRAEHQLSEINRELKARGVWTIESPMEFTYDIDDSQILSVSLEPLSEPKNGVYYTISSWKVIPTGTWESDDTLNLYMPD